MSAAFTYIIPGDPVPWRRVSTNKYGYHFDTQKDLKNSIGFLLKQQHGSQQLYCSPIDVEFSFYFAIPKSWSRKKQQAAILTHMPSRPDLTNLTKLYEDIGNHLLWVDDSLIVRESLVKLYDVIPRTEIKVTIL